MIPLIAIPVALVSYYLWYVLGLQSNRTGFDFLYFILPLSICAIVAAIKIRKSRNYINPLVINLAVIALLLFMDHFNIYVQHDKWTYRNMPERWEKSQPRQYETDAHLEEIEKFHREVAKKSREGKYASPEELKRDMDYIASEMKKRTEKKRLENEAKGIKTPTSEERFIEMRKGGHYIYISRDSLQYETDARLEEVEKFLSDIHKGDRKGKYSEEKIQRDMEYVRSEMKKREEKKRLENEAKGIKTPTFEERYIETREGNNFIYIPRSTLPENEPEPKE